MNFYSFLFKKSVILKLRLEKSSFLWYDIMNEYKKLKKEHYSMRKLEKILLKSCSYTVLTLALFYTFALVGKFTAAYIDFGTFAVFYLFGLIISLTNLVLSVEKLRFIFRIGIHYSVLLTVFCIVFVIMGKISLKSAGAVFSSIIIFTLFYAVMFAIVYILKKLTQKGDNFIESRSNKNNSQKKQKQEYKSIYK